MINVSLERYEELLTKEVAFDEVVKAIVDGIDKGKLDWNNELQLNNEKLNCFVKLHFGIELDKKIKELKEKK